MVHQDSPYLLAARDTPGDVGTNISTASEGRREIIWQVVEAAGKRLSEALRVLEEYGKVLESGEASIGNAAEVEGSRAELGPRGFSATIEQLRYRGYEVERLLGMSVLARARFGDVRLYVIITESLCRSNWLETARAAILGGADVLQLREKDLSDGELLARAKRLAALCREHGRVFIMNDRADIALASGAHGVHVGQDDLSVAAVRRIVSPQMLVGVSTHNREQVDEAIKAAPDYIAVGPMFATKTKPQSELAGPELLAYAAGATSLPIVAIGGIDEANAPTLRAASKRALCLCVCSAVISRDDPRVAAAGLVSIAR